MNFSKYFAAFSTLAALTLSAPAWADIPPDDVCLAQSEGKACNNAIVDDSTATEPGTCQKTMCTRATPDGSMTYECHRCVAEAQGSGGQSNEGGSSSSAGSDNKGGKASGGSTSGTTAGKSSTAGTSSTAGAPNPPDDGDDSDSDGGCSVSHTPGGSGSALLVLGLAMAGVLRRRSQAS